MFAFEIILLFLGLIISALFLYRLFGEKDKNAVTKVIGFEIKNLEKWLTICYVGLFVTSIIVLIGKLDKENEASIKQQFIFDNVSEVKKGLVNIDTLVKIQIDSLKIVLNSIRENADALTALDSITKNAIVNRRASLIEFNKNNDELAKGLQLNIDLTERNRHLSEQLLYNDFGGDSYPIVFPVGAMSGNFSKDQLQLKILNIGNYAQKNVRIRILDYSQMNVCAMETDSIINHSDRYDASFKCRSKSSYNYNIGDLNLDGISITKQIDFRYVDRNLTNNEGLLFHNVKIAEKQKNIELEIIIQSKNGIYNQRISISNWWGKNGHGVVRRMSTILYKVGKGDGELFKYKGLDYPNFDLPLYDPYKIY